VKSFHYVRDAAAGTRKASWRHLVFVMAVGILVVAIGPTVSPSGAATSPTTTWIVADLNGVGSLLAQTVVDAVGGKVLGTLDAADAVEATLTGVESAALSLLKGVVLTPNVGISVQSTEPPNVAARAPAAVFPEQSGATQLWADGDTGQGVNVAVLDTGIDQLPDFGSRLVGGVDLTGESNPFSDGYGHGTFVAGLIASSGSSSGGKYMGEAPGAGLVSVKVADANGETNLVTVIEGIDWTIAHAAALHIRVLNMSLGFVPFTSVYLNPLDLAVQTAWNDGIVVVVSAGNAGPFNGTILSPGDDPSVITVGAIDDLGSTSVSNDAMTTFSSAGPTNPDGFYKPDLVSSGRSVVSLAAPGSTVYANNPTARIGSANFVGSGTSFSAAVTSGAVALDLEMHPTDTPNEVKARLLGTASPGPTGNPFVDGHGVLNIAAAVLDNSVRLTQSFTPPLLSILLGGTVSLKTTWAASSWDGANWSGLQVPTSSGTVPSVTGTAWNGTAWNGTAWNGTAWNGTAWNGTAWNGTAWNGTAWNGTAWNGTAWNGTAWNGTAWNGTAWNGSAWN
jgi:serine protease AprX